ncbi:nucleoside hydrolase [Geofilum sp. OHC36d9]|uniref:nucleoside hydrolase n=1 Tax=Geofilum sp. OHC36d9 TaxID=3458413 RepID=UPI0040346044
MKKILVVFGCCFCLFILSTSAQVKIIFDTDMESDVDDVGALAMLHSLANNGEAEILGTMVCSLNPWSVPTVDALNTYFQKGDIPIGAVKTLGVYRNSKYAKVIAENFPQDIGIGENSEDAISLYRKILTNQPDSSVVIVTVGYLTNLSNLLKSEPDDINSLNGVELVRQKVKHLVCMGGRYPYTQNPGKWGNFKPDPEAVRYVAANWPGIITFTGGGEFADRIKTGRTPFNYDPDSNPVSKAYKIFLDGWRDWHHSADLIAVYIAVRGYDEFFELNTQGYNHIFEDGTLMWRVRPNNPSHQYVNSLKKGVSEVMVSKVFDDLLVKSIR